MRKFDLIASIVMTPDTDDRLKQIAAIMTGKGTDPATRQERIIRRIETAQLMRVCPRTIDNLRREGHLVPVRLPGRKRGVGFRESDVLALLNTEPSQSRGGEA